MLQLGKCLRSAALGAQWFSTPASTADAVVRTGKVSRSVKEQERECGLAAAFFKEGKRSSLRKLMKIVAKQKESNELTGRSAAFAAALAIKLGKYSEAHSMLTYASATPTVIRSSLLVKLLSSEARFDDALDELENCLQNEDELFNTANSSISNEALDDLCNAIRARGDTQKQMQRFRALQRLLTTYNRRCTKTVDELLCTPLQVTPVEDKPLESPQIPLTDKVIVQKMLDKSEKSDPVSNGDRCKHQSLEQYCQSLRKWVAEVNCWKDFHQYNTFVSAYQSRAEYFHHYSTSEDLRHRRPGQTDNEPNAVFNGVRQVGDLSAPIPSSAREVTVVRNANGSTVLSAQFVLASYVRRFFAEFIDFIFAFFIKLLIIFYLVEMEVIDLSRFDKLLGNEADLQTLVDVTQELFPLELLGKLLCSLLEALCISQSFLPRYSGQTPGKYLMHVRVIDCSSVSYIAGGSPNSVRVTGVVSVPFKAALLRSILKNVLINSLVPFSTVAFAFNHNRAIYDLLAGTIVIED